VPSYLTPGVYVEEVASSSGTLSAGATAVAAFVGFTAKAPRDNASDPEGMKPRLVTNWTQFEGLYGGFVPGAMLPHSVYGYFNNGGSMAYIVRIPNTVPSEESGHLALTAGDRALGPAVEFTTIEPNADVTVTVSPEPAADDADDDAVPTFEVTISGGDDEPEVFSGVTLGGIADAVNGTSTKVKVETKIDVDQLAADLQTMPTGSFAIEPAAPTPVSVPGRAFNGSESARTGISGLTIADDVTMVMVPDLITAATQDDGSVDLGMWK
jgi:phage tail sheath protein FI